MMRGAVLPTGKAGAVKAEMAGEREAGERPPTLPELISCRDFLGALTLLQVQGPTGDASQHHLWLAYCFFHAGQYARALQIYETLAAEAEVGAPYALYAAVCHFYLGAHERAAELAAGQPASSLSNRVRMHCAHAAGDEDGVLACSAAVDAADLEGQLSLAAIHFRRSHFQEATDIYKRALLEHKASAALNVYIALCYARLDYYDISQDLLKYLAACGDSVLAVNLRACNTFRLASGREAEAELASVRAGDAPQHDLVRHNVVVFRGGANALRDLQPLLEAVPEARLNLVVYHLRRGAVRDAYALIAELEPSLPQEYVLKGVAHAAMAQATGDEEHARSAQQLFQLVGASASECDTIPGRQCMASCFFLLRQFDDVLVFLTSIAEYFRGEDAFSWNLGLASAATGAWAQAEEALAAVQNEAWRQSSVYLLWAARVRVMAGKPAAAWQLYLELDGRRGDDARALLHLLADECFAMGHFYYACKAFQVLERLDPEARHFEGKRAAALAFVQLLAAGDAAAPASRLPEVLRMLQDSPGGGADDLMPILRAWASAGGFAL